MTTGIKILIIQYLKFQYKGRKKSDIKKQDFSALSLLTQII